MRPTLFSFTIFSNHIDVRSYPTFMFLALTMVIAGSLWFAKKRHLSKRISVLVLTVMAVSAFIGARAFHIFLNYNEYVKHPILMFSLSANGFSLYGGILAAIISGYAFCKKLKLNVWELGDTVIPWLGFGIAILRVGCFLNGCCFGKITRLPWGVTFPLLSEAHKYQLTHNQTDIFSVQPVHPTEIYELIAALLGSLMAIYLIKRKAPDGTAFLVFALWFTAFRWFDYYLMVLPPTFDAPLYFYPVLYAILIIVGLIFLMNRFKHTETMV
jgi:phosphatidylglycerol---prolipoprotein diacylglyceryl transferase